MVPKGPSSSQWSKHSNTVLHHLTKTEGVSGEFLPQSSFLKTTEHVCPLLPNHRNSSHYSLWVASIHTPSSCQTDIFKTPSALWGLKNITGSNSFPGPNQAHTLVCMSFNALNIKFSLMSWRVVKWNTLVWSLACLSMSSKLCPDVWLNALDPNYDP